MWAYSKLLVKFVVEMSYVYSSLAVTYRYGLIYNATEWL